MFAGTTRPPFRASRMPIDRVSPGAQTGPATPFVSTSPRRVGRPSEMMHRVHRRSSTARCLTICRAARLAATMSGVAHCERRRSPRTRASLRARAGRCRSKRTCARLAARCTRRRDRPSELGRRGGAPAPAGASPRCVPRQQTQVELAPNGPRDHLRIPVVMRRSR